MTLLGVNVDHVATLRQARKESFPDPVEAALAAVEAGADGITAHLREDRRHIQDADIERLKKALSVPLNFEMAATEGILAVAERVKPQWACLVPEKREELTTEGGLDVLRRADDLKKAVERLKRSGTRVSFFIEADPAAVKASFDCGADAVELHTGVYAKRFLKGSGETKAALERIIAAAQAASKCGMLVNAGHGLDYDNVGALTAAFRFNELNIGFAIIARSVMVGMGPAVREMKDRISHGPARAN